ncbi:hypothetical protein [Pseudolysinimonas sp.]
MSAWWRGNRWFVLGLVVAIPVAVAVAMIPRWFPYLERQPVPEAVALGDTVRYSGADITLTELRVLDGVEWNAPAGTDVVVATLEFDVVEASDSYCRIVVVSDEAGFERTWNPESFIDSDYEVPDRFETLCTFGEAGAYDLQLTFLVPAGQVLDPVIELNSAEALPRVLRLS